MQFFTNNTLDLELINNQTGSATPGTAALDGGFVGLINSDTVTLGRDTTAGDCTINEGGYAGYAREDITWNAASLADDGTPEAVGIVPQFRPNGSSTINIYGFFLMASDSVTLLACGQLDGAPLPMADATSAIVVTLRWRPTTGGISVDVS